MSSWNTGIQVVHLSKWSYPYLKHSVYEFELVHVELEHWNTSSPFEQVELSLFETLCL